MTKVKGSKGTEELEVELKTSKEQNSRLTDAVLMLKEQLRVERCEKEVK
jgi:hypothetical protein